MDAMWVGRDNQKLNGYIDLAFSIPFATAPMMVRIPFG
jgi:hypothetical protein